MLEMPDYVRQSVKLKQRKERTIEIKKFVFKIMCLKGGDEITILDMREMACYFWIE
jgi:hypothetical protein